MLLDADNEMQEEILQSEDNLPLSNSEAVLMMQRAIQSRNELMEQQKLKIDQNQ